MNMLLLVSLHLSCLFLVQTAPPLDSLDVIETVAAAGTEQSNEITDAATEAAATINDNANDVTDTRFDMNIIKEVSTQENNDDRDFEASSQQNHRKDNEDRIVEPKEDDVHLSGKERKSLISHLSDLDLETGTNLVLTPRQKLALKQELEVRRLGLAPWTDLSPWQRLTREQQKLFNEKYLALPQELQDYSKLQFTSLPVDRQSHAYQMFLDLNIDILVKVISRELERQREVEILFGDDEGHLDNYGEFEQLRLSSDNLVTSSDVVDDDIEFRITSKQIQQIQEELKHVESSTELVKNEEFREDFNAILQISPQQLQQLQDEINLLENSVVNYENNADRTYNEDFYGAISGVNKRLEDAQDALENHVNDQSTTFEPMISSSTPSPKSDATEPAHTTLDGLELNTETLTDSDLHEATTDEVETSAVTIENNIIDDDVDNLDYSNVSGIYLDSEMTTQIPEATEKIEVVKTQTELVQVFIDEVKDEAPTAENPSLKFEHFSEVTSKKPSKLQKVEKKKKKINSKKARKPTGRSKVKTPIDGNKRRKITQDDRQRVWQRRARTRLAYDPRRTLRVRTLDTDGGSNHQNLQPQQPSRAQLLHFKLAEAQIAKAILLQKCLNSPSTECEIS